MAQIAQTHWTAIGELNNLEGWAQPPQQSNRARGLGAEESSDLQLLFELAFSLRMAIGSPSDP